MKSLTHPVVALILLLRRHKNVQLTLILSMGMLLAGLGVHSVLAQETVTVNGETYRLKEVVRKHPVLERLRDDFKFCPTLCYTDVVQHTVIECRASDTFNGSDGPLIDKEGNYTGPTNQWAITETHDIREIRVYESTCQHTRTETIIEVLGSTPRYFPGDPDIEDPRSPYDPPFTNFDCNNYPVGHDPATGELVAEVVVDLLIEHKPLFCR